MMTPQSTVTAVPPDTGRAVFGRTLIAAVAMVAVLGAAVPATAKDACFSKEAFEAEQAMRLHTELMLTGLTCQKMVPDKNPFGKYQEFTKRNRDRLMHWEKVMISHFQKQHGGNGTRHFDTFRTELANQASRRAALITAPLYCAIQVDSAVAAPQLTAEEVQALIGLDAVLRLGGERPCKPLAPELTADQQVAAVMTQKIAAAARTYTPTMTAIASRVNPAAASSQPAATATTKPARAKPGKPANAKPAAAAKPAASKPAGAKPMAKS